MILPMCTAESGPIRELTEVVRPTRNAKPLEVHPALFCSPVQTSELGAFGANIHSGISTPKNPKTCRIRTKPSISGSLRTRKVFTMTQIDTTPMASRVECHACGT